MLGVDVTFDFRSDTPEGRDPDAVSPTLRRYHQFLWSKPLPNGELFDLDSSVPGYYLLHRSELGEFGMSSDTVIPTFKWSKLVVELVPEVETEAFSRIAYTIGGMMIFPGYQVDRKMTINQSRGWNPRIKDRFDLTVECIRRHYLGEESPLAETLGRYADVFDLFGDFSGYVDFFLLQDLVDDKSQAVNFTMPFKGFDGSPLPDSLDSYVAYRQRAVEFIEARNRRIAARVRASG